MEDHEPSNLQRQWEKTAMDMHIQLRKQIELIPAMKPDEMARLADAINISFWVSKNAATLDQKIEREEKAFD